MTTPFVIIWILTVLLYGVVAVYIWQIFRANAHVIHSPKFPQEQKSRMMFNLLIRSSNIQIALLVLTLLCLFNIMSLLTIGTVVFGNKLPEYYMSFSLAISFPILGLIGFIQYWREETPDKLGYVIRGPWARYSGIFMMVVGFGIAIFSFIYGMVAWLE